MSDITALDNLRKLASDFRSEVYKRDEADYVLEIVDEIEREISEHYQLLPLDADGVPIHVGDAIAEKPFRPNTGEKPAEVVCMLLNSDGWAIGDCDPRGHWYGPLQLEHVKPDPLKELLHDACMNATRIRCVQGVGTDISIEVDETELASYAERIRELMGGDAS